jgi:hypothetical protein
VKYKLLQDLPFLSAGAIFGKGCWVGGGWGVDKGNDKNGAHNGTKVFKKHEDLLLDSLIENIKWVEAIPESKSEKLELYESGKITREAFLETI